MGLCLSPLIVLNPFVISLIPQKIQETCFPQKDALVGGEKGHSRGSY